MNYSTLERDGYVPFRDAPGHSRNGHYNRMEIGDGKSFQQESGVSSDGGSDRDSAMLPGDFGQDLKAFIIRLDDLNLQKKPFAAGGGGQVNGTCFNYNVTR